MDNITIGIVARDEKIGKTTYQVVSQNILKYLDNKCNYIGLITHSKDYINKIKNLDLEETEKEKLLGLIGTLNDITKKNLIHEVLNAIDYNLIVTPKEIDFIIEKISEIISSAINNALHRQITHY